MTAAAARRTALAAQGFADARPSGPPTRRHLQKVLSRVRLLQLDSVNVAVRAHYMPVFSRLGGYDQSLVDDAAWSHSARRPRLLTEYWAHEASLIPVEDWPLFRWRMDRYETRYARHIRRIAESSPGLVDDVLATVKELGPIGAGTLESTVGGAVPKAKGGWWNRSDVKHVCEWLFAVGELSTGTRRGFQRLYDLPERVLPPEVRNAPPVSDEESARQLTLRAAVAHGVGTEKDLRDYYRLEPARSQRAVGELVEAGLLEQVSVQGWRNPAYRHPQARTPRSVSGRALLCPFDPLIWERDRTQRLFDFHYRIEIYVPEPKRVYGYYVFPFLLDGELVARVDLKADRVTSTLRVPGAFAEPGADTARVAAELAEELHTMAAWLELENIQVGDRGDLAARLAAAL
ncbi:crosslink repair DNA glycosylase YcaQ family protein [Actinokineospora sp. NBRC 105648]|uniref:winged helix-turn-helix domain-containing protein n=1 Tax=Actinokineospora sp. NBRC 105648 TaxID=3032206 RepID=UPI0025573304|nr:crosslink repair DNA glycosylase YcaQ family protein [Actinokineospora sp. NBRC 105648]